MIASAFPPKRIVCPCDCNQILVWRGALIIDGVAKSDYYYCDPRCCGRVEVVKS